MGLLTFLARRFVAGETMEQAIRAVKKLNEKGVKATLDILGENVNSEMEAENYVTGYMRLLEKIAEHRVDSNISLKLTMLGLDIGDKFCRDNMRRVVAKAKELNNFVRIDMEGSEYTSRTIKIFEELQQEFGNSVGIVIQAYLQRTADDIKWLTSRQANIRLCKGAYKESQEVAIAAKNEVNANFSRLLKQMLNNGVKTAMATHDEKIIKDAIGFIKENNIANDLFEFQMLYGIRRKRLFSLATAGYSARAYVPFGTHWFPYFYRRLRERKENVFFLLENIFRA